MAEIVFQNVGKPVERRVVIGLFMGENVKDESVVLHGKACGERTSAVA